MTHCLFCKIISTEEPAVILYRDDLCTVLLDVFPVSEGHALVLPNRHVALASELQAAEFRHLASVWHGLLIAYRAAGVAIEGANLLLNDGVAANQHIRHVHLHLIPRSAGDSAKALLTFATRTVNIFTGRKPLEVLNAFAARVAPHIKVHLPNCGAD